MYLILLLEDDLSLIEGLSYSLKKNGYELDIAGTVAEAVYMPVKKIKRLSIMETIGEL